MLTYRKDGMVQLRGWFRWLVFGVAALAVALVTGCGSSSTTTETTEAEPAPVTVPFSVVEARFTARAQRIAVQQSSGTTMVTVESVEVTQTGENEAMGIVTWLAQDVVYPQIKMRDTQTWWIVYDPETGELLTITGKRQTGTTPPASSSNS